MTSPDEQDDPFEVRKSKSYELLSLQLTDKYEAAYYNEGTKNARLWTKPLHAIGLAKVTTTIRYREKVAANGQPGEWKEHPQSPQHKTEVVGVELSNRGHWYIVEKDGAYLGMKLVSQSLAKYANQALVWTDAKKVRDTWKREEARRKVKAKKNRTAKA